MCTSGHGEPGRGIGLVSRTDERSEPPHCRRSAPESPGNCSANSPAGPPGRSIGSRRRPIRDILADRRGRSSLQEGDLRALRRGGVTAREAGPVGRHPRAAGKRPGRSGGTVEERLVHSAWPRGGAFEARIQRLAGRDSLDLDVVEEGRVVTSGRVDGLEGDRVRARGDREARRGVRLVRCTDGPDSRDLLAVDQNSEVLITPELIETPLCGLETQAVDPIRPAGDGLADGRAGTSLEKSDLRALGRGGIAPREAGAVGRYPRRRRTSRPSRRGGRCRTCRPRPGRPTGPRSRSRRVRASTRSCGSRRRRRPGNKASPRHRS